MICKSIPPSAAPGAAALALINWQIITPPPPPFRMKYFHAFLGFARSEGGEHLHRSHTFQPRDPFSRAIFSPNTNHAARSFARSFAPLRSFPISGRPDSCTRLLTCQTKYVCFLPPYAGAEADARPRATSLLKLIN